MSRAIKFRAWDNHGTMSNVWGMDEYSLYFNIKEPDDGIYGREPTVTRDSRSAWEVMQYTDQDDMKKNPIYEGDILRCHDKGLISVEWCDWGYWKGVPIDFERKNGQGDARDYGMLFTFGSGFEVIGNIHENPELLEK